MIDLTKPKARLATHGARVRGRRRRPGGASGKRALARGTADAPSAGARALRAAVIGVGVQGVLERGRRENVQSPHSLFSVWSYRSYGSALSALSVFSAGSILSIGSAGSILSIGSAGSIASIGTAGSVASIGASGSYATIGDPGPHRVGPGASTSSDAAAVQRMSSLLGLGALIGAATGAWRHRAA